MLGTMLHPNYQHLLSSLCLPSVTVQVLVLRESIPSLIGRKVTQNAIIILVSFSGSVPCNPVQETYVPLPRDLSSS